MHKNINSEENKPKSLLIVANKQDLPNALTTDEILNELDISQLTFDNIDIIGCCAFENC